MRGRGQHLEAHRPDASGQLGHHDGEGAVHRDDYQAAPHHAASGLHTPLGQQLRLRVFEELRACRRRRHRFQPAAGQRIDDRIRADQQATPQLTVIPLCREARLLQCRHVRPTVALLPGIRRKTQIARPAGHAGEAGENALPFGHRGGVHACRAIGAVPARSVVMEQ